MKMRVGEGEGISLLPLSEIKNLFLRIPSARSGPLFRYIVNGEAGECGRYKDTFENKKRKKEWDNENGPWMNVFSSSIVKIVAFSIPSLMHLLQYKWKGFHPRYLQISRIARRYSTLSCSRELHFQVSNHANAGVYMEQFFELNYHISCGYVPNLIEKVLFLTSLSVAKNMERGITL